MEGVLFNEGLWDVTKNGVTAVEPAAKLVEEKQSTSAMYKIVFNCGPQIQCVVNELKQGKVVWDQLKKLYGQKTTTSMIGLLQRLFQVKLDDYQNVDAYLNDIMANQSKLAKMGHGLNDVHLAHLMLIGLPIQYQPLRMTLESLNQELTSDYVRQKIQSFQLDTSGNGGNSAMLSRAKGSNSHYRAQAPSTSTSSGGSNNARTCYFCGEAGHIKPFCEKWKAEKAKRKKKQGDKKRDKANLAEDRCLLSVDTECAETALHVNSAKPWYVDSGATKHMCSEEGLHDDLQEAYHQI